MGGACTPYIISLGPRRRRGFADPRDDEIEILAAQLVRRQHVVLVAHQVEQGRVGELRDRGHSVRVIGHAGQTAKVTGAGLAFTAFPTARPFRADMAASPLTVIATFGDRAMGRDVLDQLRAHPPRSWSSTACWSG